MKEVLDLIQTTLENDAAIFAWCETNFGRDPKIFIGIDPFDPPEFDNCPMIVVSSGARFRESNQAYIDHSINVGVGIKNEAKTTGVNTVRFDGIDQLDLFANMVEIALTRAFNQSGFATHQEPTYVDVIVPPEFEAVWTYFVRVPSRLP
jgi:hypothetical protein